MDRNNLRVIEGRKMGAKPKKAASEARPRNMRARKERYLMIRLTDAQKTQIEAIADPDEPVSSWARNALIRLAKGWQLAPPGAKIIEADDMT